ncbi:MAG: hypothetical protein MJK10_20055 [Pseudomonadales bacterium]|nr:hypothetical protein [Pseudomonadales bacterium]NRA18160.1 hypothetical protein [Oceanospirillaceae bacterium]
MDLKSADRKIVPVQVQPRALVSTSIAINKDSTINFPAIVTAFTALSFPSTAWKTAMAFTEIDATCIQSIFIELYLNLFAQSNISQLQITVKINSILLYLSL